MNGIPLLTWQLHQVLLVQGDHLVSRTQAWTDDMVRQRACAAVPRGGVAQQEHQHPRHGREYGTVPFSRIRRWPKVIRLYCLVSMVRATSPPRSRILLAAKELFFEHGFTRVSTDDLAEAASISKATLYRHFDGLQGVLRAVVEAEVESFEQGVPKDVETQEELCGALSSFGFNLLSFLNQPEIIRFSQLMFEEARSHPDLAADFYSCAYERTQDDVSRLIQQGLDGGCLRSELSARDLAEQLLGLWEGFGFVRALLGLTRKPFEHPEEWSRLCVQTLLHGQRQDRSTLDATSLSACQR